MLFGQLTESSTTQKITLGEKRVEHGKTYRYVQVHASSTSAVAAGTALYLYNSATPWVGNTTATLARAALTFIGVGIGAIAVDSYGWVQTGGECDTIKVNNASTVSTLVDYAMYGCSTDGAITMLAPQAVSTLSSYLGFRILGITNASTNCGSTPLYCGGILTADM